MKSSDPMNICCGVLQGTILGTKLLILYINDMVNLANIESLSVTICNEVMKSSLL